MDCLEDRYYSQCQKHGIDSFYALKIASYYSFNRSVVKPRKIEWKDIIDYCYIHMKNDAKMKEKDKERFELIVKELAKSF